MFTETRGKALQAVSGREERVGWRGQAAGEVAEQGLDLGPQCQSEAENSRRHADERLQRRISQLRLLIIVLQKNVQSMTII